MTRDIILYVYEVTFFVVINLLFTSNNMSKRVNCTFFKTCLRVYLEFLFLFLFFYSRV